MKILNLAIIIGVSQVLIACATPRDLKDNAASPSSAASQTSGTPGVKASAGTNADGKVPPKEEAKASEGLSAFEQEILKRKDEKAKLDRERMELERARIQSLESNQTQLFDFLRDSSEKQQMIQLGMMATLSQLFPKTEAADLSFDEDCFIERIQGLEAALQKAQEQINERKKASPKEDEKAEVEKAEVKNVVDEGSSEEKAADVTAIDQTTSKDLAIIYVPTPYGPLPFLNRNDGNQAASE